MVFYYAIKGDYMSRLNRDQLLDGFKKFCSSHSCEEDCPYAFEEEMRGVNCSTLYILDRVEHIVSEAQKKPKRTGNEVTTCKILGVLKRVMDVNLGKRPGESSMAFEERKFKAFNDADELIGDTEPQCDE